jgi:hypothetical protein
MNRRANPGPEGLHLPTEILATIINELASDTKDNDDTLAALAACRLAFHTLRSLATPLFFSSIQLTDSGVFHDSRETCLSNRAKNLNQILSSDDIADSVKTFRLHCRREIFGSQPNAILISKILHRLSHVQTFALNGFRRPKMGILMFSGCAKDFRSAIQAMCKSCAIFVFGLLNLM